MWLGPEVERLVLDVLEEEFVVCRGEPEEAKSLLSVLAERQGSSLWSLTCTPSETSLVCARGWEPDGFDVEVGWRALKVRGPLDFALIGILARLTKALAEAEVPVFALSTFDTDYLLVKAEFFSRAVGALERAGCLVG